jgi:hypothetical protein
MEVAVYGQYGFALLMFPTAAADYLEYERFHVIDAIAPYINSGRCKVFSINSINNESWLNDSMHPRHKAIRHQQFNAYVTGEVLPFIHSHCGGRVLTIATGASFGALHSANTLFRRPDLVDGCIAMSGSLRPQGLHRRLLGRGCLLQFPDGLPAQPHRRGHARPPPREASHPLRRGPGQPTKNRLPSRRHSAASSAENSIPHDHQTSGATTSNLMPCASGSSVAPVDRVGLPAHVGLPASEPLSRPPPVSFSPPKAPPISAPLVPMFTLAMPQSLPLGAEERSASRRSVGEDRAAEALRHAVVHGDRFVELAVLHHVQDRREGLVSGRSRPRCSQLDDRRLHEGRHGNGLSTLPP